MGDITCSKCGEPWDAWGARNGGMSAEEYRRFMNGEGCPSCKFGIEQNYLLGSKSEIDLQSDHMASALDSSNTDDPDSTLEQLGV